MVKVKYLMGMALSVALISCGGTGDGFVEENVEFARKQIGKEIELIEASGKFIIVTWRIGAVVFSPVRFGICMS